MHLKKTKRHLVVSVRFCLVGHSLMHMLDPRDELSFVAMPKQKLLLGKHQFEQQTGARDGINYIIQYKVKPRSQLDQLMVVCVCSFEAEHQHAYNGHMGQ